MISKMRLGPSESKKLGHPDLYQYTSGELYYAGANCPHQFLISSLPSSPLPSSLPPTRIPCPCRLYPFLLVFLLNSTFLNPCPLPLSPLCFPQSLHLSHIIHPPSLLCKNLSSLFIVSRTEALPSILASYTLPFPT